LASPVFWQWVVSTADMLALQHTLALDKPYQDDDHGNDEQDMEQATERVRGNKPQNPENQ